uniref:Uncharacterized protein n=1 Tax=Timema genevievae TaxID=629358 RepID=A0A7R9PNN9_TIMGE|nr:unnamed protein product [Timema genevievae]
MAHSKTTVPSVLEPTVVVMFVCLSIRPSSCMVLMSKTGLLAGVRKPVSRPSRKVQVEFPNVAGPAPYVLRPFAGVYNPFPYGCSILCNHPADYEAKDVVKRAKDSWANEGKTLLLPEELAAIRAGLLLGSYPTPYEDGEVSVPEELFRRYTDTDSRPPTPAPTLASVMTRGSGRRCVTPDCPRERTMLVLDLRRSHSQDALTWHSFAQTREGSPDLVQPSPPPTRKKKPGVRKKGASTTVTMTKANGEESVGVDASHKLQQQVLHSVKGLSAGDASGVMTDTTTGSGDEEMTRRRGKRRRRSKRSVREGSQELDKEFQGLPEPGETQVSTLDPDSYNASARPSLAVPIFNEMLCTEAPQIQTPLLQSHRPSRVSTSFIDQATLKHLLRQLDQEVVDGEFDYKKHKVLEEALRHRLGKPVLSEEMKKVQKGLRLPPTNTELWLKLPRSFSRQSARFELPLDSRTLKSKLLHDELDTSAIIARDCHGHDTSCQYSQNVAKALGEVMGCTLPEHQAKYFRELLGWTDSDLLDFRSWAGVCALCERLLGPQFTFQVAPRAQDPCHEVEKADFETLPRRLEKLTIDHRLKTILLGIREL